MNKRAEIMTGLEQSAFWMPYTANRQFKKAPRLLARAEGMYYWTPEGRQVLDGCAGLWCVNAGHSRPKIVEAVRRQVATMDFAPTFQMGHPIAFEFADRLARIAPPGLSRVFFTNSGSEAVDTALKIALAYQRARGEGQRFRLIGRERGYHGVNFGGMSVGGIPFNRKPFASQRFGVLPDLCTAAKGLTNGTVPMGAVFVRDTIYDAFMQGPDGIELFHGYTYSGHPLACAAGLGTLETFEEEGLFERAASLDAYWQDAAHALKDARHVVDIRNLGLVAGIELEPRKGAPGRRAYETFVKSFEAGVLIRYTGDTIAFSPPLIIEKPQIDRIFETTRSILSALD